jgi:DNA sulfur modification protein DndE
MIETVKVSEKAKIQLVTLKRRTGIENWNILCRWAFCLSLKEKNPLPNENIITDSSIEMTWKTFTGGEEDLYLALLLQRAKEDDVTLDKQSINHYFKLHLHRGISYLNGANTNSISQLFGLTNN